MSSSSSPLPKSVTPRLFSDSARPTVRKRDAGTLPAPKGLPALNISDLKERALPTQVEERAVATAVLPPAPKQLRQSMVGQKMKSLPVPPMTEVQKPVVVVNRSRLLELVTPRNASSLICNTVMPLTLAAIAAALTYLVLGQYLAAVLGTAMLISFVVERVGQRLLDAALVPPPLATIDIKEEKRLMRQHADDQDTIAALTADLESVHDTQKQLQQQYDAFRDRASAQAEAAAQTRRHLQGKVDAVVADKEKSAAAHALELAKMEKTHLRRLAEAREAYTALEADHAEELREKDDELDTLDDDLKQQFDANETLKSRLADAQDGQAQLQRELRELKNLLRTAAATNDKLQGDLKIAQGAVQKAAETNAFSAAGAERISYMAANVSNVAGSFSSLMTGLFAHGVSGAIGDIQHIEQPQTRRRSSPADVPRIETGDELRVAPSHVRVSPPFGPVSELRLPQSPVPQSPQPVQPTASSSTQSTPTSPRSPASETDSRDGASSSDSDAVQPEKRQSKPLEKPQPKRKKHLATIVD